jgi:hypothetical protein
VIEMTLIASARQAFEMLQKETLWNVAIDCHSRLERSGIPHAVVGGVAVCLHGYQRTTVDLDLLVRRADTNAIRQALAEGGYSWREKECEFCSPAGIAVQFILSGERAGKGSEVFLPDPSDIKNVQQIEELPVISLPRLIEAKMACGLANPRRTHRDLADVVELIVVHKLGTSFARKIHKSLRTAFRELVQRVRN